MVLTGPLACLSPIAVMNVDKSHLLCLRFLNFLEIWDSVYIFVFQLEQSSYVFYQKNSE